MLGKRLAAASVLLWCLVWSGLGVWGACPANNPISVNALTVQGPDPTGNAGFPIAVVGATGCPLDVNVASSISQCVTQCTSPWVVSGTVTANQGTPNGFGNSSWGMQGAFASGSGQSGFPVLVGASDFNNPANTLSLQVGPVGGTYGYSSLITLPVYQAWENGSASSGSGGFAWDGRNPTTNYEGVWAIQYQANGNPSAGGTLDVVRTPSVFVPLNAIGVAAETTVYTPPAGKKFRLMGYHLAASVAGNVVLRDNTAGTIIAVIPSAAGGSGTFVDLHNGILSAAANNVLTAQGPALDTLSGELLLTAE